LPDLTFWDSIASIRRFAGMDPTAAVVEPEAQALLTRFDAHVKHFDVQPDRHQLLGRAGRGDIAKVDGKMNQRIERDDS
jgi:hypothetical protein